MDLVPYSQTSKATTSDGCVDFLSYCPALNGWLAAGWIRIGWDDKDTTEECQFAFTDETISGRATICTFTREDVRKIGFGFVLFLAAEHVRRSLNDILIIQDNTVFRLIPSTPIEQPLADEAVLRSKKLITDAPRSERRSNLLRLLNQPVFAGLDTLHLIQPQIFLEVDSVVFCPPDGVLISGWLVDPFHNLMRLRIRCEDKAVTLDLGHAISISRPDVSNEIAKQFGGISDKCGFMVFASGAYELGETPFLEIKTRTGEVGFKTLPQVKSPGIDTIKNILGVINLRYGELQEGYDLVIGPAIDAMNNFRLSRKPRVERMVFGVQPELPTCSIVVPLYGRIDFMELQLAFFAQALSRNHEIIYVLDDPRQIRAAESLAVSCFARYKIPFILANLSENVGYAPANNIGIEIASGEYICFLNSDVFPRSSDWLQSMLQTIKTKPEVGIVGALLVFEDETIQHDGCAYGSLPEFAGWAFPLHPRKGRALSNETGVHEVEAVTGACLLISAKLVRELNGFDEGYVIGDFEDVDLCRKAQAKGFKCVVDRQASLYHLERQSQGGETSPWRMNLTLYNAWRFQRRWNITPSGMVKEGMFQ